MGKREWVKVWNPSKGLEVILCKYRKARGNNFMDLSKQMLIGKIGKIVEVVSQQKDGSGCILVWVEVKETLTAWRLANLKKRKEAK